ncbi:MAG: CofH family radical SAM protein [Vampirovibrionales bacterium]
MTSSTTHNTPAQHRVQYPNVYPTVTHTSKNALEDPILSGFITPEHALYAIYEKVAHKERLTLEDGLKLYESHDLLAIGMLAELARVQAMPAEASNHVYWVRNYHINPTNICEDHCKFCAFKKGPKSPLAYKLSVEQVLEGIERYSDKHLLKEFHIVAGHYHEMNLSYYVSLLEALRKHYPEVGRKALTAAEIAYIANLDGLSIEETLKTLQAAGLQALPGGGAEVFSERVRQLVCPEKLSGEAWCDIHGMAHSMGIRSNATMLAGLGETPQERIEHILALREQQDRSGGFYSFIPLNCYYDNTSMDPSLALSGLENLKNFAVARLLLDNFQHIKSFWIHIGEKISQVGLYFGVSDIDGTVVQEKIAHSAGTATSQLLTDKALEHLIRSAGRTPIERDLFYQPVVR